MPNVAVSSLLSPLSSCSASINIPGSLSCYELENELLLSSRLSFQRAMPSSNNSNGGDDSSSEVLDAIITIPISTTDRVEIPATTSQLEVSFTNSNPASPVVSAETEAVPESEASTATVVVQTLAQVVIVDDSSLVLTMLEDLLFRLGYRVRAFSNGESLVNWVASWEQTRAEAGLGLPPPISLILMDIEMPGANGFEVTALLKANPATAAVPVVLMSGDDTHFSQVELTLLGLHAVLAKPFHIAQLSALLKAVTS